MAYHIWRVGLEIQNGFMRALAVQRRRYGWQLCQWWQLPLPEDTLRDGSLHPSAALRETLTAWRRVLPRRFSLRVGFPAQRVLQQRLPAPDSRLREPERGWFIESQAARKFLLNGESLVIDYRAESRAPETLLATAARRDEVEQWTSALAEAGLRPDVIEIVPCALRCMARQAGLRHDRLLLHGLGRDGWLWVSPLAQPLQFGVVHPDDVADGKDVAAFVSSHYQHDIEDTVYYSGLFPMERVSSSPSLAPWSPFSAFRLLQPPLPACPSAFAVAGGLALRAEDAPAC